MYRKHAGRYSAKIFTGIAATAGSTFGTVAGFLATLQKLGVDRAERRQRRRMERIEQRWRYHSSYGEVGLNGPRAVERRQRQIARGQLRAENGLVVAP